MPFVFDYHALVFVPVFDLVGDDCFVVVIDLKAHDILLPGKSFGET